MCALPSKKEEKEPSSFSIILVGLLTASFGALLGFLFMASFPAEAYSSQLAYEKKAEAMEPEAENLPGEAYYFEGAILRSRNWEVGRKQFLGGEPGVVRFTAAELNGWFSNKFRPGKVPSGEDASSFMIIPGTPNIYIAKDSDVYVSLPTDLVVYGKEYEWTFFAKGNFEPSNTGGVHFVIKQLNANCAQFPAAGSVGSSLINVMLAAYSETSEYLAILEAWNRVESVELEGDSIRLHYR